MVGIRYRIEKFMLYYSQGFFSLPVAFYICFELRFSFENAAIKQPMEKCVWIPRGLGERVSLD